MYRARGATVSLQPINIFSHLSLGSTRIVKNSENSLLNQLTFSHSMSLNYFYDDTLQFFNSLYDIIILKTKLPQNHEDKH